MGIGYGSASVDANGELYGWGANPYGAFGSGGDKPVPTKMNISNVRQVVMGTYFLLILMNNGDLYSMGTNRYGCAGHTANWTVNTSNPLTLIMSGVKQVAAGIQHGAAVKNNGDLWVWGNNVYGQLGVSLDTGKNAPHGQRLLDTGVQQVDCGAYNTFWIKNGTLYGTGYNGSNALGINNSSTTISYAVSIMPGAAKVFAGGISHGFAIKTNGELWGWGDNSYGQIGNGNTVIQPVPIFLRTGISSVSSGYYHSLFLDNSGKLFGAGYNYYGQLGIPDGMNTNSAVHYRQLASNVKSAGTGFYHSVIIENDGSLYAVGYDYRGQLGRGSTNNGSYYTRYVVQSNTVVVINTFTTTLIELKNASIISPIHKQPTMVSTTIYDSDNYKVRYRILINDIQVYPTSGWTEYTPVPFALNRNMENNLFRFGENKVTVSVSDEMGTVATREFAVVVASAPPAIREVVPGQVHKNHLVISGTITDTDDEDLVQYRILLNNVQVHPSTGFTTLEPTPAPLSTVILNTSLKMGLNTLTIEAKDDMGVISTVQKTVIKTNSLPDSVAEVVAATFKASVSDQDMDTVKYRIWFNDEQLFPGIGYTQFYNTPFTLDYKFPSSKIKLGLENKARLDLEDDMGGTSSRTITFIGDYAGLMFCDAQEKYFSTDIGELLKYLDFGTVIAGGTTISERVWVKNTLGYPVKNIRLWVNQRDLDGVNAVAEISASDAPFLSEQILVYPDTIESGQKIGFNVRVSTNRQALAGGMFDILVKADPV